MVDLTGKTILVTGGCGFIGSNFLDYIFNNYTGMAVLNIDKMGVGSRKYIPPNRNSWYSHLESDIKHIKLDYAYLPLYPSGSGVTYDYIFHFAAESHVDRSINSPYDFISNNVLGITKLLEYIRLYQSQARVINISTDEVYGDLGLIDPSFTETSNLAPRSPYAASKASADLIARSYHTTYGLDIITTRCCNNYGPWQHSEKFIPTVIRSLNEGKKIPVYGDGKNIREWIYVDDHNKSLLEIVELGRSGEVYNIGSGMELTNLDLIKCIVKHTTNTDKYEDYIEFVEDRRGHDFRYSIDSLLYFREFELTDFNAGISKTIGHYIK